MWTSETNLLQRVNLFPNSLQLCTRDTVCSGDPIHGRRRVCAWPVAALNDHCACRRSRTHGRVVTFGGTHNRSGVTEVESSPDAGTLLQRETYAEFENTSPYIHSVENKQTIDNNFEDRIWHMHMLFDESSLSGAHTIESSPDAATLLHTERQGILCTIWKDVTMHPFYKKIDNFDNRIWHMLFGESSLSDAEFRG